MHLIMILVPPVITKSPPDLQMFDGTSALWDCIATGFPEPVIQWFRPNSADPIKADSDFQVSMNMRFCFFFHIFDR